MPLNLKKIAAYLLLAVLMLSVFSAYADNEAENGEDSSGSTHYIFADIFNSVLENRPTCTAEKTELDGRKALKVIPTPETGTPDSPTLDSWSLAAGNLRADITKYRFISVTYYLDKGASFDGKMRLRLLPGSTKALAKSVMLESSHEVKKGVWSECYFKIGKDVVPNPNSDKTYINQIHFLPYGDAKTSQLSKNDVIYIEKISFFEDNPDADASVTVTYLKGKPNAAGSQLSQVVKANSSFVLPDCPYTLREADFLGWVETDGGTTKKVGETVTVEDYDISFKALWNLKNEYADSISLRFQSYANGIVDGAKTTSVYTSAETDGISAMKATVNPKGDPEKPLVLDGWSYASAKAELSVYKWMAVLYRYDAKSPVTAKMKVNIMKSGGILKNSFSAESLDTVEEGRWAFAIFDISAAEDSFEQRDEHIIRQIHIYPLGSVKTGTLSEGDTVNIGSVMFFKEKPTLSLSKSYMNGYGDGSFLPDGKITRAEAAAVVARVKAESTSDESRRISTCSFTDVDSSAWYYDNVCYLDSINALECFGSSTFEPKKPITRAELASMVYGADLANGMNASPSFSDVPKSHRLYSSIMSAAGVGLITGYSDGTFRPDNSITRAECTAVINRAIGRSGQDGEHGFFYVFSDVNPDFWAFDDIVSASVSNVMLDGKFLFDLRSPAESIKDLIVPDFSEGDALVDEIEIKTAARIEEIRSTKSDYSSITGKTYYVSPDGDDNANGLSESTPWKTVAKVNSTKLSFGDGVLFKRGCVFREEIHAQSGVTYSAYGEGDKPIICGSDRNSAEPSMWMLEYEKDGVRIWKYYDENLPDIGSITFNGGELYAKREVPSFKNGTFLVRGTDTPFEIGKHLTYDLSYFLKADSVIVGGFPDAATAKGELYLRCDKGNPGELFNSVELATKRRGVLIERTTGVTVDNLCLKYCGAAGIGGTGPVYNLTVKNCEAAWIGGAIQTYNFRGTADGRVTRAGNGIETYGTTDGFLVKNNYVREVYDAGLSHQVANGGTHSVDMSNISYIDNIVENCVYGIEYFNGGADDDTAFRTGRNILMSGNIIRRSGYGFGSTRPDGSCQAAIKSWDHRNEFEDFVIKDNIFDRSVWNLLHINADYDEWMPIMEGNTYVQTYGKPFAVFGGEKKTTFIDVKFLSPAMLGDKTAKAAFTGRGVREDDSSRENLGRFDIFLNE